jgi:glyoxylase-like metal-dependent hydrolase (beta-lactamase superfamily II)
MILLSLVTRKKDPPFLGIIYLCYDCPMTIQTIDLLSQNRSHVIAAFLVQGPKGPVLVETGPGATLPTLKNALAHHGYAPESIRHILLTHIHFDHAGAAGWWAQQGAQIYVHHRGAPHLIDPSKLIASATRIYGDQMDSLWGELCPAPADKITPVYDGDSIEVAGLTFKVIETPGHAGHHHAYCLGEAAFVGDVGGIRLPQSDFINLPTPPPEFNREIWQRSIDRLLAEPLQTIYLTHFGPVSDVADHLSELRSLLDTATDFVRERMLAGLEREEIIRQYEEWNWHRARESQTSANLIERYASSNPLYMSVDGILRYWRKRDG